MLAVVGIKSKYVPKVFRPGPYPKECPSCKTHDPDNKGWFTIVRHGHGFWSCARCNTRGQGANIIVDDKQWRRLHVPFGGE